MQRDTMLGCGKFRSYRLQRSGTEKIATRRNLGVDSLTGQTGPAPQLLATILRRPKAAFGLPRIDRIVILAGAAALVAQTD
jgi:hypothetical protein